MDGVAIGWGSACTGIGSIAGTAFTPGSIPNTFSAACWTLCTCSFVNAFCFDNGAIPVTGSGVTVDDPIPIILLFTLSSTVDTTIPFCIFSISLIIIFT